MAKTFEEFRRYHHHFFFSMPAPVVVSMIREAVIEFCRETELLVVEAEPIYVFEEQAEYDIEFEGDYEPINIRRAYLGEGESDDAKITVTSERTLNQTAYNWDILTTPNDFTHVFLTQDNKARVYPITENDVDEELRLFCPVIPTRTATSMDDDLIYNDWIEAILPGALYRLYRIKGQSWYDLEDSGRQYRAFQEFIAAGKKRALAGKSDIPPTMRWDCPAY